MSEIFWGLDSTVTPQVHLPLTQTFSHAHFLQPGVWFIIYVLGHVSDTGQ